MAYTITYSGGSIIVQDGSLNTETSLRLPGREYIGYGFHIDQDLIDLMGHFATSGPTGPVQAVTGQVWFDKHTPAGETVPNNFLKYNRGVTKGNPDWVTIAATDIDMSVSFGNVDVTYDVQIGEDLLVNGNTVLAQYASVGQDLTVTGDVTINGGDLKSNLTSFNILTENVQTLNLATSANLIEIGILAVDASTNINTNLLVEYDVTIHGDTLTTNKDTFNLLPGDTTTNGGANNTDNIVFGANTTSIEIGAITGLTNINHDLLVDGDAQILGNLNVEGNLTYLNVNTLAVEDPIIEAGSGPNGAPLTANDSKDRGLIVHYYDSGSSRKGFIGLDNSTGKYMIVKTGTVANDVITVTTYGDLVIKDLFADNITLTGDLSANNAYITNNLTANNATIAETMTANRVHANIANITFDTTADRFISLSNNLGTNFKIGDDAWIGDINIADTFGVRGVQNPANGYIVFGNADNTKLGRAGSGDLTYNGVMNPNTLKTTDLTTGAVAVGGNVTGQWILTAGSTFQATYADLAEKFEADAEYEAGTVVEIGGNKEITSVKTPLSSNVFGVISDSAAYVMNAGAGPTSTHPTVAMSGRVKVKVTGKIKKGDRLVSAGNGIARSASLEEITPFNVIGRSLEDKLDDMNDKVLAVVGARI